MPSSARTDTFLAHSAVPVAFTEEDLEQVAAGNFLVKVIYLPDPHFHDLTTVAPDEIVSTRLPPGTDPIAVATTSPKIRSAVSSLANVAASTTGHHRRGTSSSAATVTPAAGKKTSPAEVRWLN